MIRYPTLHTKSKFTQFRIYGYFNVFHVKQDRLNTRTVSRETSRYLPMQNLEKMAPNKSSAVNSPVISHKAI